MDFLSRVLFESPLWLGLFCFAAFAIVLFMRKRMESARAKRRAIPMTLAGTAVLFLVQMLVTTDRERIIEQMDAFVASIIREDSVDAGVRISPNYQSEGVGRDEFVASLADWFDLIDIRDPRFTQRTVRVEGDAAIMTLGGAATVSVRKEIGATHFAVWRIEWRRENSVWKITRIQPVSVDMIPVSSLRELRSLAR
ncbi:MAG: hypothetical protein KF841_10140 [Phycisphaerae bacterium]|nr:hypothetical protein [Phycisphaerae bacterium]